MRETRRAARAHRQSNQRIVSCFCARFTSHQRPRVVSKLRSPKFNNRATRRNVPVWRSRTVGFRKNSLDAAHDGTMSHATALAAMAAAPRALVLEVYTPLAKSATHRVSLSVDEVRMLI